MRKFRYQVQNEDLDIDRFIKADSESAAAEQIMESYFNDEPTDRLVGPQFKFRVRRVDSFFQESGEWVYFHVAGEASVSWYAYRITE